MQDVDLLGGGGVGTPRAPKPSRPQMSSAGRVGHGGRGRGNMGGRVVNNNNNNTLIPKSQIPTSSTAGRGPTGQQVTTVPRNHPNRPNPNPQPRVPGRAPAARPQSAAGRGAPPASAAAGRGGGARGGGGGAPRPAGRTPARGPTGTRGPPSSATGVARPIPGRAIDSNVQRKGRNNSQLKGGPGRGRGGGAAKSPKSQPPPPPRRKIEPLEMEMTNNANVEEEEDDSEEDENDMESLIPRDTTTGQAISPSRRNKAKKKRSATAATSSQTMTSSVVDEMSTLHNMYCGGHIRPQPIGNMWIILPDYQESVGWGVAGPHWWGPIFVWLILLVATHFLMKASLKLGPLSVILCILFCTTSTVLLLDVSYRDPGICTKTEILSTTNGDGNGNDNSGDWRWCDFCKVYQPPDGAHCPDCNVCVAGYDHHCVWMGTCIGKGNYRQFIRFNLSWLYYLAFAFFWIISFGPLIKGV